MRVVILHNAVPPDAPPEDLDTLVEVEAIAGALGRLGHAAETLPCELDLGELHKEISRRRPEVVFNMVESLGGDDSLVYLPPALLDAMAVPYCGCRTESLFLTTHKTLAKERMRQAGLPTPDWIEGNGRVGQVCRVGQAERSPTKVAEEHGGTALRLSHPTSSWIIKGVWDQGSRGMGDDAVVRDATPEEVQKRLAARAAETRRPCFAEQFIDGREFNLSMLAGADGPETLPPAEIVFEDFPPGKPRIVGHTAKWQEDSFEYAHTVRRFDFSESDLALLDRLRELARQCWTLFRLGGWARVDFRVDAAGRPWILEVNGNPCLSPDAGFAAALARASILYDEGMRRILADVEQ